MLLLSADVLALQSTSSPRIKLLFKTYVCQCVRKKHYKIFLKHKNIIKPQNNCHNLVVHKPLREVNILIHSNGISLSSLNEIKLILFFGSNSQRKASN